MTTSATRCSVQEADGASVHAPTRLSAALQAAEFSVTLCGRRLRG